VEAEENIPCIGNGTAKYWNGKRQNFKTHENLMTNVVMQGKGF
jgi:hypothetical protein